MHLLAHALVGWGDEAETVGQIAGDFVRGRDLSGYPAALSRGIRHHRLLDSFTDRHPVAAVSRARLHGPWRRFASVLVDLAYGHALACSWPSHCAQPIDAFESDVHATLARWHPRLPERLQRAHHRMAEHRVLAGIGDTDGVQRACERLAHRLPALRGAHDAVDGVSAELHTDFQAFWPDLLAYHATLTDAANPPA
ncbi:MAG: ACP phosphodiesterase [Pseudomonadota bacterium]